MGKILKGASLWAASIFLAFSCSINYDDAIQKEEGKDIPDLVFNDTHFERFSDGKKNSEVAASLLEFYTRDKRVFGKEVEFRIFDNHQEVSAEGKAESISANQKDEVYSLLDGAEISSYSQDMRITGKNFRWDNKIEQLVAGKTDEVVIEYGVVTGKSTKLGVKGVGFSASSLGLEYKFIEPSFGLVATERDNLDEFSGERKRLSRLPDLGAKLQKSDVSADNRSEKSPDSAEGGEALQEEAEEPVGEAASSPQNPSEGEAALQEEAEEPADKDNGESE